ncbi:MULTISPECIES: DUF982 domain-containing protein [Mesorhizobium]|uniref:DUF982 domain-containing protein n=1 Tax=Mesorhizobium TaxID=68287 RepID=UPI001FE483D8|nr:MULTISPECIES: DUF982 domain-containing protein [Mesorhizobium]
MENFGLSSASEAAILLMEKWPQEHGSIYRDALQACTGSLASKDEVENARQAFLAAAEEAGRPFKASITTRTLHRRVR